MLLLTNTLSGEKEEFKSIKNGFVGIYNCGPTVYDYVHIGNLRAFLTADILRRSLEYFGYDVKQVMNVTDVGIGGNDDEGEDKIIKGLKREKKPITLEAMRELTEFYTNAFLQDIGELNILSPHHLPKASQHIDEDIALIRILEDKEFTYKTSDGIYFDTNKDPSYPKLGGISAEASTQYSMPRIKENAQKRNSRDFALWKFNSDIGFESPWGKGFPGWHIECSAMSQKYLGSHFDIHTGGADLASIHHNNEIVQSENACQCEFVNYWIHNAFVQISDSKMAKSEGNQITLQSLKERGMKPLSYRYLILQARYNSPVEFSWEALEGAQNAYKKIVRVFHHLGEITGKVSQKYLSEFDNAISDDIDTPKGISIIWELFKDESVTDADKRASALKFDEVLGLNLLDEKIDEKIDFKSLPVAVQELILEREEVRKEKNFSKSDEIRDKLAILGYSINDRPSGPEISAL